MELDPAIELPQRRGFDHLPVAVCLQVLTQPAGAVGGITQDG
jgi:hypothetical protein